MEVFKFALFCIDKKIFWEAASTENVTEFARDLSLCFASKVNPETREIVVSCLQTSSAKLRKRIDVFIGIYESYDQKIHRIRTFISSIPDGQHFYFLPNRDSVRSDEEYIFTAALMAENANRDPEKEIKDMKEILGSFLSSYIVDGKITNKKTAIGEPSKRKRVCRFCKNTRAEIEGKDTEHKARTSFKQEAHAISEALGNKTLIIHEECDACNHYFSKNCEKHILTYLRFLATFFKVKNKDNSVSTIKGKNFEFIHLSAEKKAKLLNVAEQKGIKIQSTGERLNESDVPTQAVQTISDADFVLKYFPTEAERADAVAFPQSIPLRFHEKLSLQEVYKALVKFSMSVIKTENLFGFEKTLEWIAECNTKSQLPKIAILQSYKHFSKSAELTVYRRKNEDGKLPFAVGEFQFTFQKLVFIIPTFNDTESSFLTNDEYEKFWSFFMFKQASGWQFQDFSDAEAKDFVFNMNFSEKQKNGN